MIVNSIPDIKSFFYSWYFFGKMWELIAASGLFLLPIILLIIKESINARNSGIDEGNPGFLAVKRIETGCISIMVIILTACMPIKLKGFEVSVSTIDYQSNINQCIPPENKDGNVKKHFEKLSGEINKERIYLPLLWGVVHSFSTAITNYMTSVLPCKDDLTYELLDLSRTNIKDEKIKEGVYNFFEDCYKQAKLKYYKENPVGEDDVSWIASKYLLNSKYYKETKIGPLEGWPDNPSFKDSQRPDLVYSSCSEYWNNSSIGLRKQILDQVNPEFREQYLTKLYSYFEYFEKKNIAKEDALIHTVLGNTFIKDLGIDVSSPNEESLIAQAVAGAGMGAVGAGVAAATGVAVTGGVALIPIGVAAIVASAPEILRSAILLYETISTNAAIKIYRASANFMLSVAQMILILAIPMILFLSGFSFSKLALCIVGYFSLEFINFIWAFAYWMQVVFLDDFFVSTEWDANQKMIITILGYTFYLVAPVAWLAIISWAGFNVVSGISEYQKTTSGTAQSVGSGVANTAKSAGTKAVGTKAVSGKK